MAGWEVGNGRLAGWQFGRFVGWEVGRLNSPKQQGWVNDDVVGLTGGLRKMGDGGEEGWGKGQREGKVTVRKEEGGEWKTEKRIE